MDTESDLPDLPGVSLAQIRLVEEALIADALRRILAQLDSGTEPVAGFQSAV